MPFGRICLGSVSPKEGIKVGVARYYMRRTSEAQLRNVGMALSMIIAVLVAVISTALVVGGTPPIFIPVTKGEGDRRRGSARRQQNLLVRRGSPRCSQP